MDLHGRYNELMDARRIFISRDEAHFIFEFDYDAPPQIVWDWFNDPIQRGKWMRSEILSILRIRGRSGAVGARNHCVHGDKQVVVEDILDIKPFEYVTVRHTPQGAKVALEITFRFDPASENKTRFTMLCKGVMPYMPEWFKKQFCRFIVRTQLFSLWKLESINDLVKNHQEGE